MTLFCLFLSHHLFNSVPVKWTEVASPALKNFLMRFCGLCVLIPWCIVQSFPSIVGLSCCRQSQAGGSWPRSPWTESKPRMDTTMFSTSALVHALWRMNSCLCLIQSAMHDSSSEHLGAQTHLTWYLNGIKSYIKKHVSEICQWRHISNWYFAPVIKRDFMPHIGKAFAYLTLLSSSIRWLSGVESYHHLQQRHRHYGGGAAGRAASIQGTLFLGTAWKSEVDSVTKQILHFTAYIS